VILRLLPVVFALFVFSHQASAQDVKRDLSGVWAGPMLATGMNLKGRELPFKPGGEQIFYRKETGDISKDDPTAVCLPDGMPREALSPYPTQILQPPGYVVIVYEYEHFVRIIPTDGRAHRKDVDPTWMGDPVGRWEGDTLVVDTVGVKEEVLGYRDIPHSDQMRIKERFHLVSPDILHDEVTIEDPVVLEKPWTFTFAYKRSPGYQMLEYVCDNNREYVDDKGVTRMRLQNR
jgi:hypothetical protein